MLGGAETNARALKQGRDGLYPLTFKGCGQLAVNDAQCGVRVKAEAVRLLVGNHLDERVEQVIRSYLGRNDLLAVHAVHQAHDDGVFPHHLPDAVQRPGQGTVFQGHDEQIGSVGLFRGPDLRVIHLAVDADAVLQPPGTLALGHHAQTDARFLRQPPKDIGPHGSRAQNGHFFEFHTASSPLF